MIEVIKHTLLGAAKLTPFLFLTYLLMEFWEHKTKDKTKQIMKKAGRFGPLIGAAVGMLPQCGFSAAASGLYAGRIITLGTLIAIFLSTSDEMLPILISEAVPVKVILMILGLKFLIGMLAGFLIDLIIRPGKATGNPIHEICEHDHCHCEEGSVLKSALYHTVKILLFIMLVTFFLNLVLHFGGKEALTSFWMNKPVVGELFSGLIGLIPNCAASVVITQLYLEGAMSFGAMMSGLLVSAGVGILILFRVNADKKETFKIIGLLYGIGVVAGFLIELTGIQPL